MFLFAMQGIVGTSLSPSLIQHGVLVRSLWIPRKALMESLRSHAWFHTRRLIHDTLGLGGRSLSSPDTMRVTRVLTQSTNIKQTMQNNTNTENKLLPLLYSMLQNTNFHIDLFLRFLVLIFFKVVLLFNA